ncbi:methyl-accepting chemotaxis protein, partial [Vibrio parahaemolyticus]
VQVSAEEISKGNAGLSSRVQQQAASLEETAASMEEITATVKQTADNSRLANQLAAAARERAAQGGSVVDQAVRAMHQIR